MRTTFLGLALIVLTAVTIAQEREAGDTPRYQADAREDSSACDSVGFLEAAKQSEELRKTRRLNAAEFAQCASDPDTIVLDARGQTAYEHLHVKGSVNLPYTAFSEESLKRIIPKKSDRVLIYCRNNLSTLQIKNSTPVETGRLSTVDNNFSLPVGTRRSITIGLANDFGTTLSPAADLELAYTKGQMAGLNIPTYITLYVYGYHNVWELDPVVDPNDSPIIFEGKGSAEE